MKQWEYLQKLSENKRIPQAIIFAGPSSLGKRDMALKYIKSIQDIDYPDLIIIEPEKKVIQIDQIRELQKRFSLRSSFKACIIDRAETMNSQAQNCLLKTLEEPKGNTLIILITSKPESLLETIRSRCQILKFYSSEICFRGQENFKEIEKILLADVSSRLSFFQEYFGKEYCFEDVDNFLESFENYLRMGMLKKTGVLDCDFPEDYPLEKISDNLNVLEEYKVIILNTNTSSKLAFENLMLKI